MRSPGAPIAGAPTSDAAPTEPVPPTHVLPIEPAPDAALSAAPIDPPAPIEPAPRSTNDGPHASYVLLWVVSFLAAASDLATKYYAKTHLSGYDPKIGGAKRFTLLDEHIDFVFAQNPGGAWSFLRNLPEYIRRPFFLFISAGAIVFIVTIYRKVRPEQVAMKWGLPLALGGAIGNLVDRIRYGYVIDFVDIYVVRGANEHHWPTFNVADIWICVGVLLMAIDMLAGSRRASLEEGAEQPAASPSAEPTPATGLPEPPG